MGLGQWNHDVCLEGTLLTGLFNFGIPGIFMLAGSLLESTAWFKALLKDDAFRAEVVKMLVGALGEEAASGLSLANVASICYTFIDGVGGFLVMKAVGTVLAKLQEYIIEKLAESAFEKTVTAVNVIFQIANRGLDLEELAATTIEFLCSPAVYEVDIVRTLNLSVTVSPIQHMEPARFPLSGRWRALPTSNRPVPGRYGAPAEQWNGRCWKSLTADHSDV